MKSLIIVVYATIYLTLNTYAQQVGKLSDKRDGHVYKTVKIGNQLWMAENLVFKTSTNSWAYDNNDRNAVTFGRLYKWETAKNICPDGWRLPTKNDYLILIDEAGGKGSAAYKAFSPNGGLGFSTLFGGYRSDNGSFVRKGDYTSFWTLTEDDESYAWNLRVSESFKTASLNIENKSSALSVRCLKNN